MYIVYALISIRRDWIYVGFSDNIEDRINRHQKVYEKTTAPYRPFTVIQLACAFERIEARRLEKWYKTSYSKATIRILITTPFHGGDSSLSADR
jgi:putative endonuclease